jgi:PAS domain S-box-containing protein
LFGAYYQIEAQFTLDSTGYLHFISIAAIITAGVLLRVFVKRFNRLTSDLKTQVDTHQKRLTQILKATNAGLWQWCLVTNCSHWSRETFMLFGLPPDTDKPPAVEQFLDLVHPDDRKVVTNWYKECLSGKYPDSIEFRTLRDTGEIRWLQCNNILELNEFSQPVKIFTTLQDITKTKSLLAEKQLWADAFQYCAHGIAIDDPESRRIISCNPAFANLLGFNSHEDVGGIPILSLYDPEQREKISAHIAYADKHGNVGFQSAYRRKDGSTVEAQIDLVSVKDAFNHTIYRVATIQDISERIKSEEQLHKLTNAVEQSPEAIIITDSNGTIEYVNKAFSDNSGYRPDEVIGNKPSLLKSDKTPLSTYSTLWKTLSKGYSWKGEFINKRKDGSEYVDFAKISPIRQTDGKITHYVSIQEDITHKKRLAKELDHYRFRLEEMVASRTQELIAARAQAESANKAKSAFLANMSHEIRTPMNAIIGLSYLLQKTRLSAEQKSHLQQIDSSAEHLLSVINDILDLSKIEAGEMKLEETDFNLQSLFEHISSILSGQVKSKGIPLQFDCGDAPVLLCGDPTRLRQALINYTANALKFTEKGSVWVRVKLLEETNSGLMLRFEVQDTGIGIAPDKLSMLFEAFCQTDSSTTRKYGGTGLGLAITRYIANAMGGEAGVESVLGQGSVFWFTAKLRKGKQLDHPDIVSGISNAKELLIQYYSDTKLLLVEDNLINRVVALSILQNAGMSVDTAENGQVALKKISSEQYDLILMDMMMPEMDGISATRTIRLFPGFENLPIIAMTANAFNEDRLACVAAGMNDYIVKPVVPDLLYEKLLYWLSCASEQKLAPAAGARLQENILTAKNEQ